MSKEMKNLELVSSKQRKCMAVTWDRQTWTGNGNSKKNTSRFWQVREEKVGNVKGDRQKSVSNKREEGIDIVRRNLRVKPYYVG